MLDNLNTLTLQVSVAIFSFFMMQSLTNENIYTQILWNPFFKTAPLNNKF